MKPTSVSLPQAKTALHNQPDSLYCSGYFGRSTLQALAFLSDGRLLTGGGSGLTLFQANSLTPQRHFPLLSVYRIVPLRDNTGVVLSGAKDGVLVLASLRFETGELHIIKRYPERISFYYAPIGFALSPDASVVYINEAGGVCAYNLTTGDERLWPLNDHRADALIACADDGKRVATFSRHSKHGEDNLFIWSSDGEIVAKRALHSRAGAICFTPDSRLLLADDGGSLLLDSLSLRDEQKAPMSLFCGSVSAVSISPDRRYIAASGLWGWARVQSYPDFKELGLTTQRGNEDWSGSVYDVVACSNTHLAVYAPRFGELALWSLNNFDAPVEALHGYSWGIRELSITDDLSQLVYTTKARRCIWHLDATSATITESPQSNPHCASISGDGKHLASAFGHGVSRKTIEVRRCSDQQVLESTQGRTGVRAVFWSHDSSHFLILQGANDDYNLPGAGDLSLRKLGQPKAVKKVNVKTHTPWAASLSPDNQRLAVIWDQQAELYAAPKWKLQLSLSMPEEAIAVAVHPGALCLAASCQKNWTLPGGLWLADLQGKRELPLERAATALAFSLDGSLLFVGLLSGEILVYRVDELRLMTTLTGHREEVTTLCVKRGVLVSASNDGQILCWSSR